MLQVCLHKMAGLARYIIDRASAGMIGVKCGRASTERTIQFWRDGMRQVWG